MIDIADVGVRTAVEHALGHQPPFSEAELAEITELNVLHAGEVSSLQHCSGLIKLELVACDIRTLTDVSGLAHLSSLHVLGCPVEDATALLANKSLEDVRIDFCFLQDLSPLTEMGQLRRGRFIGDPFEPASWHDIRPAWRRARTARTEQVRLLEFGPDEAWEATRAMWDRQVRLSFGLLDGLRPALVRPGIPRIPGAALDSCHAVAAGLIIATEQGESTEEIFQENYEFAESQGLERPSDFSVHRTFGDAYDAHAWVESASPDDYQLLQRFIRHFPDCDFFHEDEVVFAAKAAQSGFPIPPPLALARAVLAGALPDRGARFRLSAYAGDSPRADRNQDIWYYPSPGIYSTAERKDLILGEARLFPLAEWIETGRSILAVSIAEDDSAIYEFGEEDLYDALAGGRPIADSIYRVFSSYAELLAHIDAYKLPDQTVITAVADIGQEK